MEFKDAGRFGDVGGACWLQPCCFSFLFTRIEFPRYPRLGVVTWLIAECLAGRYYFLPATKHSVASHTHDGPDEVNRGTLNRHTSAPRHGSLSARAAFPRRQILHGPLGARRPQLLWWIDGEPPREW